MIDYEAWAEELQRSKLDLIELLQEHMEIVEELKEKNEEIQRLETELMVTR